jgi:signal peptidase II
MKRFRVSIFLAVLLTCVGCDHVTKQIAQSVLTGSPGVSLAADTLRFELATNPGAFLSLGAGLSSGLRRLIFLGLVPGLLAIICVVALRSRFSSGWSLLGLAFIAGGGLSNWIDRLLHGGAVTDFMSFGLGSLRTGVLNLADLFIVAGVALLLLLWRRPGDSGDAFS